MLFAGRVPKLPGSDNYLPDSVDDALAVDDAVVLDYKSWVNFFVPISRVLVCVCVCACVCPSVSDVTHSVQRSNWYVLYYQTLQ